MTTVNIETFSDSDFNLEQEIPDIVIGSNALHMQIRTLAEDHTVWVDLTRANGMLTVVAGVNPDPDKVVVHIPYSKLLNLPAGDYVHSLIMSAESGTVRTELWRGTLTHKVGPTRWAANTP